MIAYIGELRYTGIPTTRHSVLSTRPGTKVLGQVPRYSVGANCLLGGFWAPAGVHDRIPSDSCKSRFNITALKRPTTVQQCPMILQKTFHRLACLVCSTSDQPIVLVPRYSTTLVPRLSPVNTQVPRCLGTHAGTQVPSLAQRLLGGPHPRTAGSQNNILERSWPICSGMQAGRADQIRQERKQGWGGMQSRIMRFTTPRHRNPQSLRLFHLRAN